MALTPVTYDLGVLDNGTMQLSNADGTTPEQPPGGIEAPSNFRLQDNATDSQTVAWNHSGDLISGFHLQSKIGGVDSDFKDDDDSIASSTRQHTKSGLPPNTRIDYRIASYTEEVLPPDPPPSEGDTDLDKIWWYENFGSVPNGAKASDYVDINNAGRGYGDTSPAITPASDPRSFETWIGEEPTSGFGLWGFTKRLPDLKEGDELWIRAKHLYPSDYDWDGDRGGRIKHFRLRCRKTDGSAGSYADTYIGDGDKRCLYTREGEQWGGDEGNGDAFHWFLNERGERAKLVHGRWQVYEMYYYLSKDPKKAINRLWLDGKWAGDVNHMNIRDSQPTVYNFYYHTYWNANPDFIVPPQFPQSHNVDNFAIAIQGGGRNDKQYLDVDSAGRVFIGLAEK